MTRHIESTTLNEIRLLYGQKCVISGSSNVHLHHNAIYGYRQISDAWAILPISPKIHDIIHGKGDYLPQERRELQMRLDYIMLSHAPESDLIKYSKVRDLIRYRDVLKEIYEKEK
jgi:hypothetical protein